MAQTGATSRTVLAALWSLVGAAMVTVPIWLGWTRGGVLLAGHPLSLAVTVGCGLVGVVALAWGVATLLLGPRADREAAQVWPPAHTRAELRRRAGWRVALAAPALVICVLTVSVLGWSRPYAAAPEALETLQSRPGVRVADRLTWYELQPNRTDSAGRPIKPTVGLVFYPGARVDPRAYARLLGPAAAAGYLVVVLKAPLGIGLLHPGAADSVLSVHPDIKRWAVGGHSLGGVAAASYADDHPLVKGLVLYAAYPAGRLRRTDLRVLSVSGSADGLSTPAKIAAAKADLPRTTRYVVVHGAAHSSFGDYGHQAGDQQPSIPRSRAQALIAQPTVSLLASLVPPAKRVAKR